MNKILDVSKLDIRSFFRLFMNRLNLKLVINDGVKR